MIENLPSFSKLPIRKWRVICYLGTSEVRKEKLTYTWNCQCAILNFITEQGKRVNCFNLQVCKLIKSIPHGNQKCLSWNFFIRKKVHTAFVRIVERFGFIQFWKNWCWLLYIEPHTWYFFLLEMKELNDNLFTEKPFRQFPQRGCCPDKVLKKTFKKAVILHLPIYTGEFKAECGF